MDNTMFAYLFGAFILGFLVAWIAGRSGPNRALKECEAQGQTLQRTIKERDGAIAKAEAQLIERQAVTDRLTAEQATAAAALQAAEQQLATASQELDAVQTRANADAGEILRLRAELRHVGDALAGARTRSTELGSQLELADRTTAVMEVEVGEAVVAAQEAIAVATAEEIAANAQIEEMAARLQLMNRELDLTRAAAARTTAMALMRPQLTPARREEYAALANDPNQVVQALHERDIAVADAVNETSYLRRSLGIMTAMGSELAGALDKRNREYDAVALRLARMTLAPPPAPPVVETPAEPVAPAASAEEVTDATPLAAPLAVATAASEADELDAAFTELQRKIDELQAQLTAAGAAQGDLEGRLQAQGLSYDTLVTRLADISAELETLGADEDATQTPPLDADAETAPAPAVAATDAIPGDDVIKRLTAGVALAMSAIQRKNAHVAGLIAEREGLESGLAEKEQLLVDQSTQLQSLQDDLSDRSVKFDALSLHSSSLEVAVEQALHDRTQLDDQVRQLAVALTSLADQYAPQALPVADAPAETADAPVAETATTIDAPDEADSRVATTVEVVAEVTDEGAENPAPAAQPEETENSGIALLAAAVARIRAVVARQETDLADASARLATLADQLDTVDSEEAALSATISDQEAALEDAKQQLATLQGELATAVAARDGFQQRIDNYHAQLGDLLAQYAEPETEETAAPTAGEPTAAVEPTEAVAAAESAAPLAEGALETAVDAAPDAADAAPAEDAPADAVAAAIAAIGAIFVRKQASLEQTALRLTAMESQWADEAEAKRALDATLADKEQALTAAMESYAGLQSQFGQRSAQFDAVGLRASSLEADLEIARMERAKFESQIQAVADKLAEIAASYAEAPAPAPDADAAATDAADEAVDAAPSAPVVLPLATQLETNAAAVVAVVESKSTALTAAQLQLAALEQDLSSRSGDLDSVAAQTAELEAQLAATTAAKAELESTLAEIGQKVEAMRIEFDEAPVVADETEPAAEGEKMDGPAATLAGIAGVGVVLARRRQALEETQAQTAALTQQVAELTAQLEAAELDREQIRQNLDAGGQQIEALNQQIADLQTQLDEAIAARDSLQTSLDEIGANLQALGAAVDADDDEQEEVAAASLVKAGLVAGGATALVGASRSKRNALKDANTQIEALQQQLATAAAAETEIQTRVSSQLVELEATSNQVSEMQARLDALAAEKAAVAETLQRQLEETQVQLQEQDEMVVGLRRQLDLEVEWQRKSPFLTGLIQKLNKWTGVKALAASGALEEQAIPKTVKLPDNLSYVTHIGKTYADRLHAADIGTYWELAFVSDEELAQILKLNELQAMGMNFDEVRASARALAAENGSVGHLWERVAYDDFEKIRGIGSKLEKRLYDAGITTYAQLVEMTPEQLNEICQPKPPLRPQYDQWITQAQELLAARAQAEATGSAESVAAPAVETGAEVEDAG